jgi:hypothetical protein
VLLLEKGENENGSAFTDSVPDLVRPLLLCTWLFHSTKELLSAPLGTLNLHVLVNSRPLQPSVAFIATESPRMPPVQKLIIVTVC